MVHGSLWELWRRQGPRAPSRRCHTSRRHLRRRQGASPRRLAHRIMPALALRLKRPSNGGWTAASTRWRGSPTITPPLRRARLPAPPPLPLAASSRRRRRQETLAALTALQQQRGAPQHHSKQAHCSRHGPPPRSPAAAAARRCPLPADV